MFVCKDIIYFILRFLNIYHFLLLFKSLFFHIYIFSIHMKRYCYIILKFKNYPSNNNSLYFIYLFFFNILKVISGWAILRSGRYSDSINYGIQKFEKEENHK